MGSGKINGAERKVLKGSSFATSLTIESVNSHAKITATPVVSLGDGQLAALFRLNQLNRNQEKEIMARRSIQRNTK